MNIVKVPCSFFDENLGTKDTPQKVVEKLKNFQFNEDNTPVLFQLKEIEETEKIFEESKGFFKTAEKNLFVGGDHGVTLPLIKAFTENFNNTGIIIFDAHADCQDEQDLVPALIKNNLIKKENIVLVGLRNRSIKEHNFLQQNNIKQFSMREISMEGNFEVSESIMSIARRFDALYISIDADVLDPAFVSVNCPEPGGMTTRELLFFLHRLKRLRSFKAADLTELNPESALVGAKIIAELF
ncbi:MAG: arginase family protein [Candidatus Woesearchaeota archaeon]